MKKSNLSLLIMLLVFACIAPLPEAMGVVPPPDGGYPNQNTAEGDHSLFKLTTGVNNVAIGFHALYSNTTGVNNVATGHNALVSNTTGNENTATGGGALFGNTTGLENTATGNVALNFNTTGSFNTATGAVALLSNTTGDENTATGVGALFSNTIGYANTATGVAALGSNTTGLFNTANGVAALYTNTTGIANTANGFNALSDNTAGQSNTADGLEALTFNTVGNENTATGVDALAFNTSGDANTAAGFQALLNNTTGGNNIGLGYNAGSNLTSGSNNIDIGSAGVAEEAATIRIGTTGTQSSAFIAGIRGVSTGTGDALPVLIDSAGQLGTASSSRRFKHDIQPIDKSSEAILALKPVTFHYKSDKTNTPQFGLIAEEVANVDPHLVVRDDKGEIYTVRYDAVNAMLLNEFLKEHRKVETQQTKIEKQEASITQLNTELQATAARQQNEIEELSSGLQKISVQFAAASPFGGGLGLRKSAPHMVVNNQ